MKYFVEEITVMKDGSAAVSIVEKATKQEARSGYHQAMASAIINQDVASIHAEAKNNVGGLYESGTWVAEGETFFEEE